MGNEVILLNKPKYKYLIYRILKNFKYPQYDYVKINYFEYSKKIILILRKHIEVPYLKVSINYLKTGITTECYKTHYVPFCKSYTITDEKIEHIKHDDIINKIRTDFENSIKDYEVIK